MALNVNFRWASPKVTVPEGSRFRTSGAQQAFSDVAGAITAAKQSQYRKEQDRLARERQATLDARNEEDRQRRIAEEDRQKAAYADVESIIKNRESGLLQLRAERDRVRAEIAQIEAELNG